MNFDLVKIFSNFSSILANLTTEPWGSLCPSHVGDSDRARSNNWPPLDSKLKKTAEKYHKIFKQIHCIPHLRVAFLPIE